MINILSYVGMNMQAEVCLWTLLGLMRTIFDATLFKVNANLKQVWQMSMPEELSMPVQRVLRTMISGIMLVQCFTVYVYLAAYIVLLYPVFLEERPTLVLPWLLLAAIRKLLCELTSLALGLGTCVLLGTAKPPCIRFLISKIVTIMPAFYMWMLVYSYYHALKVATAFKTFPVVLPPNLDYGLELAVRRRCTKSLFGEEQLRKKLVAGFYAEQSDITETIPIKPASRSDSSCDDPLDRDVTRMSVASPKYAADIGSYEDWFGSEIFIPRGDRILEQFVVMLLRIGTYLNKNSAESLKSQMFNSTLTDSRSTRENIDAMATDVTDTPPLVGSSKGNTASYVREYPQIFMKKFGSDSTQPISKTGQVNSKSTSSNAVKSRQYPPTNKSYKHTDTILDIKRNISDRTLSVCKTKSSQSSVNNYSLPPLKETIQDSIMGTEEEIPHDKMLEKKKEFDEFMLQKNDCASRTLLLPASNDTKQSFISLNKQPDKTAPVDIDLKESAHSVHSKSERVGICLDLKLSPTSNKSVHILKDTAEPHLETLLKDPPEQIKNALKVTRGPESKEVSKDFLVPRTNDTEPDATFSGQAKENNLLQNGNDQNPHRKGKSSTVACHEATSSRKNISATTSLNSHDSSSPDGDKQNRKKKE